MYQQKATWTHVAFLLNQIMKRLPFILYVLAVIAYIFRHGTPAQDNVVNACKL